MNANKLYEKVNNLHLLHHMHHHLQNYLYLVINKNNDAMINFKIHHDKDINLLFVPDFETSHFYFIMNY
jgi:hypothetical protein